MKIQSALRAFLLGASLVTAPCVQAATLTWDPTGGGTSDGAGAWLTVGDWWDGASNVSWTSGDDAIFGNGGAGGAVTLTGLTTVNSLTFNSFTGTYTLGTAGAGNTITLNNGITMNSGVGAATIISPITLGAAQSWTNNDDSLLTIGTGAVTNGGFLLTVGGTGNTTISSVISGAGGLSKTGAGTLTLSGASTFTGGVTLSEGTTSFTSTGLGSASAANKITFSGNSTLQWGAATTTDLSARLIINNGVTATLDTGANNVTFASIFGLQNNSNGTLNKTGSGILTLGNTVNQFAGNIVISGGRVALGGQYSMWQSAYDTTGSTGAIGLNVTGQANPWLGGLAGSVNLATAITGYGSVASLNLNPQSGSSVSYGGVIANGAAGMTLNKTGHGTQILTNTNTYSGATTVWAGTLALAGASGTAQSSAFTVRGGTLLLDNSGGTWADRISDSAALSLGSLTLTSDNGGVAQTETVGATTFAIGGKVTINNGTGAGTTLAMGAVTRSVGAAIDFVGIGGTLGSGASNPNVTSSSLLANTNGILHWATVGGTQWAENNSNSIRAYSGGFTTLAAATNTTQAQQTGAATLGGALNTNSLNVISDGSSNILALGGNTISFGSTNVAGTLGAILKSGTNDYTISGGTIRVGTGGAGNELITHVDGGALTISANLNTTIVNLAKGGTGDLILSGTRAGTMSGAISIAGGQLEFQGASTTLSGVITGAGGLTVNLNAGQTLTMGNNSNSYAGPTIVKGGYLAFPAYNSIGLPGGLGQTPGTNTSLISSNLILNGGVFNSSYVFNKDLGAGPGQVQILAGTSGFVNTASSGGASGFTLDGGREIVWGSTYFNPTVFVHSLNSNNNSTLNLGNGFDLNGSTRTVLVGDATYNSTVGVSQLGGNIRNSSGTAGLTKTGIGTLLLSGTNTYNGATTISSGILRFSNQVSLYNNTSASWTAANIVVANTGTLALNVGGSGQFTTGNVTTLLTNLGGANGTSTTGFAAGSSIGFDTTNAAGSTFTVADNIADSSGAGGGALGVVKLGTNTLVLSGTNNSYSGATVIRGGTLSLTGSLTGNTAISTADNNNGGGGTVLNGILNQSAAGVISGATASFTQGSSGTSILSGDNSYGGGTTLNAGTLTVGHANALGTGAGTIRLNGGTIQSSSATARTFTNSVLIGGNFTVGGTGNMTFSNTGTSALGATRTITVTNSGVNATFAQAFSGATFGITKAGAGTLTLTGNNTYTGVTTINAGSVVLSNDGDVTGSAITLAGSNTSLTVTGGSGVISTWNLSGGDLSASGTPNTNIQMLIDGAGTAGSARVINVNILAWGRTASNSTLSLTNGGQMNVNGEIRTGNPYYGTTGNTDLVIGGGTATSTFTGNNQAFYIGYGERNASKDNDVTVNSGGVLTGIGNMFVGHVNYGVALGTSTNNKLTVDGTGTASMASVTVGYAQVGFDAANANVVQVTNGGTLTTSGTNYIGRATVAGAISNANTATITGTGSTWNAGAQTIYVGHTNNATATSNNNILTVGTGGTLNASSVIVGFGTGTETGNQLVLNGGSLTATTVTVSASNSLEFGVNGGSLIGNIINNGSLNISSNVAVSLAGNISGTGSITQTGSGVTVLSGTNIYNGGSNISQGTLTFLNTNAKASTGTHAFAAGTTLGLGVSGANAYTASDITNAFNGTMTGNLSGITVTATTNIGVDTTNGNFTYNDSISGSPTNGLTKLGINTLTLTGTNTYTGATLVSAGTLFISGSLVSDVTVSDGAMLAGGGTVDDLILGGGSLFDIFLAVDSSDSLAATNISFAATGFGIDNLRANGSAVDWGTVSDGIYTLITGTLNSTNLENFGSGNAYDLGGGRSAYFQEGSLQLVVATIPEPKTALLGVLGIILLLRRRR